MHCPKTRSRLTASSSCMHPGMVNSFVGSVNAYTSCQVDDNSSLMAFSPRCRYSGADKQGILSAIVLIKHVQQMYCIGARYKYVKKTNKKKTFFTLSSVNISVFRKSKYTQQMYIFTWGRVKCNVIALKPGLGDRTKILYLDFCLQIARDAEVAFLFYWYSLIAYNKMNVLWFNLIIHIDLHSSL